MAKLFTMFIEDRTTEFNPYVQPGFIESDMISEEPETVEDFISAVYDEIKANTEIVHNAQGILNAIDTRNYQVLDDQVYLIVE